MSRETESRIIIVDDLRLDITFDLIRLKDLVQECADSLARAKPNQFPADCVAKSSTSANTLDVEIIGAIQNSEGKIFDLRVTVNIPWSEINTVVNLKKYGASDIMFPLELTQLDRLELQKLIIKAIWTGAERKLERNLWDDIFWGMTNRK